MAASPRTVVVTGAANGNGRAIALAFAAAGDLVIATDIDLPGLEHLAADIATAGGRCTIRRLDVADRTAVAAAAGDIAAAHGHINVLVNNAGIIIRGGIQEADALDTWTHIRRVNVDGLLAMTHAFVPQLVATRGAIINLASIVSFAAQGRALAYSASKGAVKQITQALAVELAPKGVRVNAIAPGVIETAMTEVTRANPDARETFLRRIPMGRFGQPDELAGAVLFLASDAASYITGAVLPIDGGFLAG